MEPAKLYLAARAEESSINDGGAAKRIFWYLGHVI
jgi:hypothetical protein